MLTAGRYKFSEFSPPTPTPNSKSEQSEMKYKPVHNRALHVDSQYMPAQGQV